MKFKKAVLDFLRVEEQGMATTAFKIDKLINYISAHSLGFSKVCIFVIIT